MSDNEYTIDELETLLELIWKSGSRTEETRELYHKTQQMIIDSEKAID